MKLILKSILFGLLTGGALVTPLSAQVHKAVAEIPFTFVVGSQTLPAGQYSVSQIRPESPAFLINDDHGHSISVIMGSNEDGNPTKPSLTFAHAGTTYLLVRITPPGSLTAHSLAAKTVERTLGRKFGVAAMVSVKLAR